MEKTYKLPTRKPDDYLEIKKGEKAKVWQEKDHWVVCWEKDFNFIYSQSSPNWKDVWYKNKVASALNCANLIVLEYLEDQKKFKEKHGEERFKKIKRFIKYGRA